MNYKLYLVGGIIRDEFLGIKSNDVDYSVVIDSDKTMSEIFFEFVEQLKSEGFEVFLETEDCFTVRAMFPKSHKCSGVADFVLARKELYYPENGRKPVSVLGTLEDDLRRRDFTVNAMAKDSEGKIIDLFGGYKDLRYGILDTPGDPYKSFKADPLRIIRGMRFCITKDFVFCREVRAAINEIGIKGLEVVSQERIMAELHKCFKHNSRATIKYMMYMQDTLGFPILDYVFDGTDLWLEPTNKKR